jgi:hypothetical protein
MSVARTTRLSSIRRAREIFAPEVLEAGPEPDVGRARDLGLEGDQALYGLQRKCVLPLQQHLAGEGRPVQFAERKDVIRSAHQGIGSPPRKAPKTSMVPA